GRGAGRGAHIESIEQILDSDRNTVERSNQPAGPGKRGVEFSCPVQPVRNIRVVWAAVRAFHLLGETQCGAFIFFEVQGDERVNLSGIGDRRDIPQYESGRGIDTSSNTGPAVRLDAFEIQIH